MNSPKLQSGPAGLVDVFLTSGGILVTYSQHTVDSPSRLTRYAHGERFRMAVSLLDISDDDRILDYGTGDGHFLEVIRGVNVKAPLVGYDPLPWTTEQLDRLSSRLALVTVTDDVRSLKGSVFTRIACLEVLEHLCLSDQRSALTDMKRLVADDGHIVLSIPLEGGLSSLFKNLNRLRLGQAHPDTSFKTILKSLFGMRIRDDSIDRYYMGHMGFSAGKVSALIRELGFVIVKKQYCPLPFLRGFFNSQLFYVLRVDRPTPPFR